MMMFPPSLKLNRSRGYQDNRVENNADFGMRIVDCEAWISAAVNPVGARNLRPMISELNSSCRDRSSLIKRWWFSDETAIIEGSRDRWQRVRFLSFRINFDQHSCRSQCVPDHFPVI